MEDYWVEWEGSSNICPVPRNTLTKVLFRNGDEAEDDHPQTWRWDDTGAEWDIVAYRIIGENEAEVPAPTASDGGSSDYYKLTIENEAGETIQCEMKDIIRCVYGDNFSLGNIAKAARRMYEASQGRGKEGASIAYDANKVRYFASEFERWNKGD